VILEYYEDLGVSPWVGPYSMPGAHAKHTKVSTSTYGASLYSIFIGPFVDAAKVVGAELGQVGFRVWKRLDGKVTDASAIKLFQNSAS
jgi:hypothetical protein